ncbi:hypothetical protein QTN25_010354 [Entamoeba marina]
MSEKKAPHSKFGSIKRRRKSIRQMSLVQPVSFDFNIPDVTDIIQQIQEHNIVVNNGDLLCDFLINFVQHNHTELFLSNGRIYIDSAESLFHLLFLIDNNLITRYTLFYPKLLSEKKLLLLLINSINNNTSDLTLIAQTLMMLRNLLTITSLDFCDEMLYNHTKGFVDLLQSQTSKHPFSELKQEIRDIRYTLGEIYVSANTMMYKYTISKVYNTPEKHTTQIEPISFDVVPRPTQILNDKCYIPLLTCNIKVLAFHLCHCEMMFLTHIFPTDFYEYLMKRSCNSNNSESKIKKYLDWSQALKRWVQYEVVSKGNKELQTEAIKMFIQIAVFCLHRHNFNSSLIIIEALQHYIVQRMSNAWSLLDELFMQYYQVLCDNKQTLCDISILPRPPCVPAFSYHLQRMEEFDEDKQNTIELTTLIKIGSLVDQITKYRTSTFVGAIPINPSYVQYLTQSIVSFNFDDASLLRYSVLTEPLN